MGILTSGFMDHKKYIEKIDQSLWKLQEIFELAGSYNPHNETKLAWIKVRSYLDTLFNELAPFREGDRVILSKPVDFSKAPGWIGALSFLQPGVKGTVRSVDMRDSKFIAYVEWDNQTYINTEGETHPVDKPGRYLHSEDSLQVLNNLTEDLNAE